MGDKLGAVDTAVVAVYLAGMIAIGAVVSRRIKAFKDYFLAGGALTTPLLVCTLVSTYYGLEVTFGTSETAFYYGLAGWAWYSVPYYLFILIAAFVIAPRIRRYKFMTLPDILEHHYGPAARVVSAFPCLIYSMPIISMGAIVMMLELFGLPGELGFAVTVGICALYTVMGGLWADAISDTIQFTLMCATLALVIPMALAKHGGFEFVAALEPEMTQLGGGLSPWMLAAWAATGLTVLVEPAFYQRVFAAKDTRTVVRSLVLGIVLWAAYDWAVVVIGMIAASAAQAGTIALDPDASDAGKQALLAVCIDLLPTGLRGLFLGGILAAAMSTIDSYSLLSSGNLVYDIYRPLRRGRVSDRQLLILTRIGVFVVIGASAYIGSQFEKIRDAWLFMASCLTSVTLVPVMAALFLRPRRLAGLAGAVGGFVALIAFYILLFRFGEFDEYHEEWLVRLGPVELWQGAAALFAVPISAIALALGHALGRKEPVA